LKELDFNKSGGARFMLKRLKKAIKAFLEKLAKENEEAYGKNVPDCCSLNRQSNISRK
jgi:hypothetical protein